MAANIFGACCGRYGRIGHNEADARLMPVISVTGQKLRQNIGFFRVSDAWRKP